MDSGTEFNPDHRDVRQAMGGEDRVVMRGGADLGVEVTTESEQTVLGG